MKLDRIDRRILTEMQQNGRISNLELAERVGLSPTPCSRRVKQLEEAGIIRQHVTLLNPDRLNLKLTALIQISMDRHTPDRFENFQARVATFPEVVECSLITGQAADYLVKVVVPDMDAYQQFLLGKITRIEGVSGVQSSFVMQQIINKTALPLDYLT
ncbi:Lrp/AsnC family transcriptional regulator [Sedimenticola thiotaurini]|uniref:AsnC family transcriptional regulator n=1 Tax=Sedimenticola thiotaurini TaxID=1543721 RepID=A0A0F7JWW9_9GAMM|nr:Lrp/AsnC family transcriptional regulator [Sedimenticola thiotaurini]AKH20102.1 AsnC family transcriptional regulator [Sedimenticola thiotaurini]